MDSNKKLDNEELIKQIREGNERALNPVYEANRKPFIRWAIWNYKCDDYDAADVYQKAFAIFYFNIKDGKLVTLTSKVETYLYAIGKRLFLEKQRDKHQQNLNLEDVPEVSQLDISYFDKESQTQRQLVVEGLLKKVGEACSRVLKMYYYHKFSMEAIAEEMDYKNDFVAKKKKYECLQKLKMMATGLSPDDLLST
ncbi:MAG: sigma-70 family RNA polymerase sigma factor [Bacteroidia bacterium]|nr:sigma-70 family RNA polymerase sigma factor [Bacteroidia bacterium]